MYHTRLFIEPDFVIHNALEAANKTDVTLTDNSTYISTRNESSYSLEEDEFIFDRTDVRAIFITLYTIVFCCCFFGKLVNKVPYLRNPDMSQTTIKCGLIAVVQLVKTRRPWPVVNDFLC